MKKLCAAIVLMALLLAVALGATADDLFAWDDAAATRILLEGAAITVEGDGVETDGATATITKAGTYVLSGTLDDGQIRIDAGKDDVVTLVLSGATLSSSTSAPIYFLQADEAILILADGTENVVTDAMAYQYADGEDEPDAAIFAKDDLTIGGNGSLTVTGNYNNGIGTKDDLVIGGGTIAVTAANDALRGRDSVTIDGGTLTLTSGNDGIKANNDEDADKGWIAINGGTLDITSNNDGIQAETALTISGGDLTITTTGQQQGEDSDSYKGLKATTLLEINGGAITIDAADDALHSNGDLTITGGTLALATGDDGAHADGALTISGGDILITASYEGLEGATVAISGGAIELTATDDGINAAGGTDGEAGLWGGDSFRTGGSGDYWIEISGGSLVVNADGDGLDSNGALTISGGAVIVNGPTQSMNGAIDADGAITVTGGTLITGETGGMSGLPGSGSTQAYLAVSYTDGLLAGDTITLTDAQGTTLATYTVGKSGYRLILFSTPELATGQAYTVTTSSGIVTETTLDSLHQVITQTGEATSAGMGGGGRGGFGGGRMNSGTPPEGGTERPSGRQ